MKKISTIILFIVLFFYTPIISQTPDIEWQNTIGSSGNDYLYSIQQTSDNGYLVGGYCWSDASGDKTEDTQGDRDYWIVKLNSIGNIEWDNTIGGSAADRVFSAKQTLDGGYILGGYSFSGISGDKTETNNGICDYWIIKLDVTGQNIEWQKSIGGNDYDYFRCIQQTSDGGYIIGGDSDSGISGDKTEANQGGRDFWIVKLDGNGNIVWQNTIGGNSKDDVCAIQQTTDGGYIVGGTSESGASGDKTENNRGDINEPQDYWIVKLDATGQIIEWQKTIGGSSDDRLFSIQQTDDGGYVLGGISLSDASCDKTENTIWNGGGMRNDYWVIKLDATGQTIEWQNTIGGISTDELRAIEQINDGGYIIGGSSDSGIFGDKSENSKGAEDFWIVKLDVSGNLVWQRTIGGSASDQIRSMQQTTDGGFILGGTSESGISVDKTEEGKGGWDYWIVKLSAEKLAVQYDNHLQLIEAFTVLPAYPNPFNPSTTIVYGLEYDRHIKVEIYDISGKLITTLQDEYQTQGWHSVIWNGTNQYGEQIPTGLYFSKITSGNEVKTTKLMLLN